MTKKRQRRTKAQLASSLAVSRRAVRNMAAAMGGFLHRQPASGASVATPESNLWTAI